MIRDQKQIQVDKTESILAAVAIRSIVLSSK